MLQLILLLIQALFQLQKQLLQLRRLHAQMFMWVTHFHVLVLEQIQELLILELVLQ